MKSFLIISADDSLQQKVAQAIGVDDASEIDRWADPSTLSDAAALVSAPMRGRPPEVVVLGSDLARDALQRLAGLIGANWKQASLLLVTEPTTEALRSAMQLGFRDVLDSGEDTDAWGAVLTLARQFAQERGSEARASQAIDPGPATEGRIVVVVSSKGGTGKTTIATNIAVGLAQSEPHATVIVDLDMEFGDVANALRITPDHSLADFVFGPARNDAMVLKSFLSEHESGLYAICAPEAPEAAVGITGEHVSHLLAQLSNEYHYVVVDTAPGLADQTLAALDQASDIVYVCGMDVPSIRGLRKEMDLLAELRLDAPREHLVLNNADTRVGITLADVQRVLGRDIDIIIPPARSIKLSTNEGDPLVHQTTRGRVARAFRALIARVVDPRPPAQVVTSPAPARGATTAGVHAIGFTAGIGAPARPPARARRRHSGSR